MNFGIRALRRARKRDMDISAGTAGPSQKDGTVVLVQPNPAERKFVMSFPVPGGPSSENLVQEDVAERTIESTSSACRYSLEEVLEQPAGSLSEACEAEVGRILDDKAHHKAGAGKPRPGGDKSGTDAPTTSSRTGSKNEQSEDHGTQAETIVLTFVSLVLVAVVALAYCARVGRPKRGGKRLHKKKQERIRERGKKRR